MTSPVLPGADPIPLPAPVWLMKFLELLTLSLHFVALQLFLGGLIIATIWAIYGRAAGKGSARDAAGTIAHRLPIVMTYVINLGVPPLLFTQVLYGRALYTSSVIIGTFWISVVFILMITYSCLYIMSKRAEKGKGYGLAAVVALVTALLIAWIYSANMTLMLRPEAWRGMYRADSAGVQLPTGDATLMPRVLYMVLGALTVAGCGMMLVGLKKRLAGSTALFLRVWGGRIAALGVLLQAVTGYMVWSAQPDGIVADVMQNSFWQISLYGWVATGVLVFLAAVVSQARAASAGVVLPVATSLFAFLNIAAMVVVRDGIRDVTLLRSGFDVWDRVVVTNWSVVILFFILFVMGLGVAGWLISVAAKAKGVEESYV